MSDITPTSFDQSNKNDPFWNRVACGAPDECWLWMAGKTTAGYGEFMLKGVMYTAHRYAYMLIHGPIPKGFEVCHNCPNGDNPSCCNPAHLWLGTHAENMADMAQKGRSGNRVYYGDDHWTRRLPGKLARGDDHWTHKNPELIRRGKDAWAATHPERMARGDLNGARLHPETRARGDRNGMRLHPESVSRGQSNGNSKLTETTVREIRQLYAAGGIGQQKLANMFGVSKQHIRRIIRREVWAHVQ